MDGVLVINKPKDYTSHDVVAVLRKVLSTKKVGHTGTLDPNATGVLPILVGQGTKLSKYLIEHDKTYIATLKLGKKTDTGDSSGNVIEEDERNVREYDIYPSTKQNVSNKSLQQTLETFIGKQKQIPPMYSAIKVEGKKLYEYARQGVTIENKPRDIEIYNIELKNICDNEITFEVSCSKGTYIRVLCEDIARELGTVRTYERIAKNDFSVNLR